MSAYYNEHDKFAAAWLRELIAENLIAPGEVDERSIEDVLPSDLAGFVQCHFFAGIGIWSLAFRQAGWPDDAPVWTGSCPCQPFSAAGKGAGFADERHLWPAFHWLIEQCGPELVLGEQVASKDGLAWLDLVSADLEATGYAFGAADTCAAGFGAPHIRQRLYWMADATNDHRGSGERAAEAGAWADGERGRGLASCGDAGGLAIAAGAGSQGIAVPGSARPRSEGSAAERAGASDGLADANGRHPGAEGLQRSGEQRQQPQDGGAGGMVLADGRGWAPRRTASASTGYGSAAEPTGGEHRPSPLNGLWRAADWLCCTDGKWRPVAPGTFPLAPGGTVRNRVGLLRGAGNAINLAQAQGFIEAVMELRAQSRLAA